MKPVPQLPPVFPVVTDGGRPSEAFEIYLKKMEAALKELQERVEVLEGYHP